MLTGKVNNFVKQNKKSEEEEKKRMKMELKLEPTKLFVCTEFVFEMHRKSRNRS